MFLHSVTVQEQLISADGVFQFEMAVNPLSVILIHLKPLNDTGTLASFQSYKGICAALNRVTLSFRGESIISGRGEDLAALNYFRWGIMPFQGQHDDTDNERRSAVLPLILGRFPYDPRSCFPATRRGELFLELDIDIADTGYDGLRLSVESIELLEAKPVEFERKITISQTFAATGDNLVDLPVGNLIRGALLFGTTPFLGAAPAPSWGRVRALLDNREVGYAASDFEVIQMLHTLWGRQPPAYDGHMHRVDATAVVTTQPTLSGPFNVGSGIAGATDITGWNQYGYLDFDPTGNDAHSIQTGGHTRFALRADVETADAVRVISVEAVKV